MQKILATLAILIMAACGSAAQTGPKTSNPPLTSDQKAKHDDGQKPAVEVDGQTLKVNALSFQMTLTSAPWKGSIDEQDGGNLRLVFLRPDIPAALIIIPSKVEKTDAKSFAENWQKQASDAGMIVTPVVAESNGRYAFTADTVSDGKSVRTYVGMMPHPTIADAYLIFMASSDSKDSDAFLAEVRAIADSVGPIQ